METIEEAKQYLTENWRDGVKCPCCTQRVQLYKRKLPWATCVVMIAMSRAKPDSEGYIYLPPILEKLPRTAQQGGYATLAHWWGLIEHKKGYRDDGSNRVGYWRLTDLGDRFVHNWATVPSHALVFNGKLFGLEGEQIDIKQALGNKFDYRELMQPEARQGSLV